jgi:hypothetical protein
MVGTMFVDIIPGKPSRDFTRPLGMPRGLKSSSKYKNTSHERNIYLVVFQFILCFLLLRD